MGARFKPALNAFFNFAASLRDLAAALFNMAFFIKRDNPPLSSGISSIANDFKLYKEENLTLNRSGYKERI
jgi:hypothetical protein